MAVSFRYLFPAAGLAAACVLSGCSGPAASAPAQGSSGSAAAPPSSAAPTPTVSYGPGYGSSASSSLLKPAAKPWASAAGWLAGGARNPVGLKHGVAYLTTGSAGTSATPDSGSAGPGFAVLNVADAHGVQVAQSQVPPDMSSANLGAPQLTAAYTGGHPYLILSQTGTIAPPDGTTKKAGDGLHYVVLDAESGKIVADKTYASEGDPGFLEVKADGESVSFLVRVGGVDHQHVINPVTGAVDTVNVPAGQDWMGRVDGVDIFGGSQGMGTGPTTLIAPNWTQLVPEGGGGGVEAFGPYLNARSGPDTMGCAILDVHTGKPVTGSDKLGSACLQAVPEAHGESVLYWGVLVADRRVDFNAEHDYLRPSDGAFVKTNSATDTFGPALIGADGVVYGTSSPVPGQQVPAALDLSKGAAATIGDASTVLPDAVSGDGVGAFTTVSSGSGPAVAFLNSGS